MTIKYTWVWDDDHHTDYEYAPEPEQIRDGIAEGIYYRHFAGRIPKGDTLMACLKDLANEIIFLGMDNEFVEDVKDYCEDDAKDKYHYDSANRD